MKTLSFKLSAVIPGQKSNLLAATPQLIANSTNGKFTITAPVSKALNIAVGECVMFFNNRENIEQRIAIGDADVKAYAEEKGYDLLTTEGQNAFVNDFLEYYIAKGERQYKTNGEPLMVAVRFSREEKEKFIADHAAELVEANREVLLERAGTDDATDDELAALITVDDIDSPTTQAIYGSRTSTTSNKTGVGLQLGFTDSNIWNQLKADMSEENKVKMNRYFDVDLSTPIHTAFHNGKEEVDVLAYPISYKEDKEVSRNFGRQEEE